MTTIKAVVKNGRIEVEEPIDLPDGTQLMIPLPDPAEEVGILDKDLPEDPKAVEDWIRWYDALQPLEFKGLLHDSRRD